MLFIASELDIICSFVTTLENETMVEDFLIEINHHHPLIPLDVEGDEAPYHVDILS